MQVTRLILEDDFAAYAPGDVIKTRLRLLDGFGQEAQPAAGERFELLMDVPQLAAAGGGSKEYSVFCRPGLACDAADAGVRVPWPAVVASSGSRAFASGVSVEFRLRPPPGIPQLAPVVMNMTRVRCGAGSAYDPTAGFCEACGRGQYVTDPDGGRCIDCPVGAACDGSSLAGSPNTSAWAVDPSAGDGALRLQWCPAGSVLVRDEARPALDQCVLCPPGKLSTEPALYPAASGAPALWSTSAADAYLLCRACPGASPPSSPDLKCISKRHVGCCIVQ